MPRAAFVVLAATLLVAPPALAGGDATTAEALFLEGRAAVERGDYATACPKFAESDRLDPGAGTRINLADCEEHVGHPAAAWRHWREALELLPPGDTRVPLVKERADQSDKRVPRLKISLSGSAPGVRIERDGVEIGVASLEVPLPVEPGEHVVVVTAPGHAPSEQHLVLAESERKTMTVKVGPLLEAPAPASAPARERAPFPFRTVGFVTAAVGGVALVAGGAFGLAAISAKSDMNGNCNPTTVCNDRGADAAGRGHAFATAATWTTLGGGVLAATGLVLVLTHPSRATRGPANLALSVRPAGASVEGTF